MARKVISGNRVIVSDENERLILVDESDQPCGLASKAACHDGEGLLHRAFSLFVVDRNGHVLMQQRSAQKRLWPLFWSNSCCSHPREGETMQEAMQRRLEEELGIRCDFKFLFKFRYQEEFGTAGSEHEFCWVYVGRSDDSVQRNHNEIAAWRFIKPSVLNRMLEEDAEQFTPWFRMEWQRIMLHHLQEFEALTEISCAQAAATRSLSA